jgi:hypothetical protein
MPGPPPGHCHIQGVVPSITGMQRPKPVLSDAALPPALIYSAAVLCGVLAALALQMLLSRAGFDLAAVWENLFATGARQLRTTGPWWATAGIAFIASGATAAALSRAPLPWRRFRLLRWAAGAIIVFLLADIGHSAAAPEGVGAGVNVAARLAALAVAGLMAVLGAYLTVRR